ncbi:unnamed protein product [Caenorhabditis bovis]|uniref:Uncharacterized protein n=1 Tax=Caenorhabditis bovis TaxID=2654633 RepID=A0A8S1F8E7_9PELO|nr:unnamed protein product [Caenorhabditis bovis]
MNILTFCYTYRRLIGARRSDMDDCFTTIYGSSMVGWDLGIDKFSELPFPAILIQPRLVSRYAITIVEDAMRDTYPDVLRIELRVRLVNSDGSGILPNCTKCKN